MHDLDPIPAEAPAHAPLYDPSPTPPEPTLPPKPTLRRLFLGDDGLRAGWSVLLFIVLAILLSKASSFLIHHFHLLPPRTPPATTQSVPTEMSPRTSLIGEIISFSVFAIAAFFMSLIERRPFGRYGLTSARMPVDFLTGLFWGFASLSVLIGMLYATHAIAFNGLLLHGSEAIVFALKWGAVFLFVGLFEEFFFRGYLQYTVARGVAGITRAIDPTNRYSHLLGFWITASIFSIGFFMVAHLGNGGETPAGIFAVGLAGAVFAFSLYRTGSLWWGIGMHTSWDWAQSYFYGTADSGTISHGRLFASHPVGSRLLSGGPDGPEGSVLVIPALLLVALVIHFTLPRRNYPLTPDQSPRPQDAVAIQDQPTPSIYTHHSQ